MRCQRVRIDGMSSQAFPNRRLTVYNHEATNLIVDHRRSRVGEEVGDCHARAHIASLSTTVATLAPCSGNHAGCLNRLETNLVYISPHCCTHGFWLWIACRIAESVLGACTDWDSGECVTDDSVRSRFDPFGS